MPEPLTFKIITDADDSGVRKYDNSLGSLNVSSRKASSALNAFSKDIMQAKSGADLASASAESLAHVFHQGLAGALIIGGVKVLSDQIKVMGETVRGAGEETARATKELEKMGAPGSLDDAIKATGMLDSHLEAVTKKLEGIKGGNWFVKMLADVTGTNKELEANAKTLQYLRDAQLAEGFLVQKMNAQKLSGASDEIKSIEAVNQKYEQQKKIAETITDQNAKKNALSDIESAKASDFYDLKTKLQKKQDDQIAKSAELQDKVNQAQANEAIRRGEIAGVVGAAGGSARGAGQRKTSFEIGMERQAKIAEQQQTRKEIEAKQLKIAKSIGKTQEVVDSFTGRKKTVITDMNAVRNQLIEDKKTQKMEEVKKAFDTSAYEKATKDATDAQKKNNDSINTTQIALDKLSGTTQQTTDEMKKLGDQTKENTSVSAEAAGGAKATTQPTTSLDDVYNLLDGVLSELVDITRELGTYAHVT